jgi:hypothetical protein
MTGYVAENINRRWIAFEQSEEYLKGASFRFRADGMAQTNPRPQFHEQQFGEPPQQAALFELPPSTKTIREEPIEIEY